MEVLDVNIQKIGIPKPRDSSFATHKVSARQQDAFHSIQYVDGGVRRLFRSVLCVSCRQQAQYQHIEKD